MKRILFYAIIQITIINNCHSQDLLNSLNSFDYQKSKQIILDSILIKGKIMEKCQFEDIEPDKIEIKIIPVCNFDLSSFPYIRNTSITRYLNISTNYISAFVYYDKKYLGFIKADFTDEVLKKLSDSIDEFIVPSLDDIVHSGNYIWKIDNYASSFCKADNDYKTKEFASLFIKNNETLKFFIFPVYIWEIWFIEDNKLKAFSLFNNRVYEEFDIINGIVSVDFFGNSVYFLDYKKNYYKDN